MTLTGKHTLTMPFNSGSDVEARLRDPANLTSQEVVTSCRGCIKSA